VKKQIWQHWVNLVVGLWLIVSPFPIEHLTMAEPTTPALVVAAWTMHIIGLLIAATAIGTITYFRMWEEWVNIILGGWLIVSPWLFGFSSSMLLTWNALISGAIVVVSAAWVIAAGRDRQEA
jgi:hypothetical protein